MNHQLLNEYRKRIKTLEKIADFADRLEEIMDMQEQEIDTLQRQLKCQSPLQQPPSIN
jgi:bacterioferritin (cytochrome b1)